MARTVDKFTRVFEGDILTVRRCVNILLRNPGAGFAITPSDSPGNRVLSLTEFSLTLIQEHMKLLEG
jgi:hypothetical protein